MQTPLRWYAGGQKWYSMRPYVIHIWHTRCIYMARMWYAHAKLSYDFGMDSTKQILPGRANRLLRGHIAEIKGWREAGYTISSIQQLLALKGITVARTTVAREVARLASAAPTPPPPKVATAAPEKPPIESAVADSQPESTPIEDAKKKVPTADEFFKAYNDNPLFRRKEKKP